MFYNGLVEIAFPGVKYVVYKLSELGEHLSLDIIQYEIFEHTH